PAELDRAEPARDGSLQLLAQRLDFIKEQRAVRLDLRAVVAAQEPRHRLARDLAEEIPERDVDAADGVLDAPAAALPERVLPQLLADACWLIGPLADQEW